MDPKTEALLFLLRKAHEAGNQRGHASQDEAEKHIAAILEDAARPKTKAK